MKLETYVGYMLRHEVTTQEAAAATGYSRNAFSSHSRAGTLPIDRIHAAFEHWQEEAAGQGADLNLTDALVEMGYLPAPTQDFRPAPVLTETKKSGHKAKRDLTEYGY